MTSVFTPVERSSPSPESRSLSFVRVAEDFVPLARPLLGKGSLGSVRLVKDKQTGTLYAMKTIDKNEASDPVSLSYLKSEIKIQKSLQHPHITKLEFCCEDEQNLYLILSYAENGSLLQYLRNKRRPLSEEEAFVYLYQTANALQYLHMKNIIHRDLKPANILLDGRGNVKICDFGWSVLEYSAANNAALSGTLDYLAPEILVGQKASPAADVWSLGIIFYEMLHAHMLFGNDTSTSQRIKMVKEKKEIPLRSELSVVCQNLLVGLLSHGHAKRTTLDSLFTDPFMLHHAKKMRINIKDATLTNMDRIRQELSTAKTLGSQPYNKFDFTLPEDLSGRTSSVKTPRKSLADEVWKRRPSKQGTWGDADTRPSSPTKEANVTAR